jgi:hypothetical protein
VPAIYNVTSILDGQATAGVTQTAPGVFSAPSLRAAIQAANAQAVGAGANTINLTVPGVYRITIPGAGEDANLTGDFDILPNNNLSITNTSGGNVVVDGGGIDRVFDINPLNATAPTGTLVTFTGFTIQDGRAFSTPAQADTGAASGGGIRDVGNVSLTLTNMILANNTASADGGGVSMENANSTPWTLTLNNTTVTGNRAGDAGGGIEEDGHGKVVVTGSTIASNTSVNQGAGIWLDGIQQFPGPLVSAVVTNGGTGYTSAPTVSFMRGEGDTTGGGATATAAIDPATGAVTSITITNGGTGWNAQPVVTLTGGGGTGAMANAFVASQSASLTVTNSLVQGNVSLATGQFGGGIGNAGDAGGMANGVSITGSTLAFNSVNGLGGGYGDEQGQASVFIVNSTFVNNSAAVYGGGIQSFGPSTIINDTTIAGNSAQTLGGGVFVPSGTFFLNNSVVARNVSGPMNFLNGTNPPVAPDLFGKTTGSSGDFIGAVDGTTSVTNGVNGNFAGTTATPLDPLLGPLQNNGGPTPTEAPLPGSPLIDKGINLFLPPGVTTDQRGGPRILNGSGGAVVDIGAIEFQPPTTTTSLTASPATAALGTTVTLTATVTPQNPPPNNAVTGTVTFFNGTTPISSPVTVGANGVATLQTATLPAGALQLKAVYNGDFNFATSSSPATTLKVNTGKTIGEFDPTTATFFLSPRNGPGAPSAGQFVFGGPGFLAVVGDWQGTGQTTPAVVDPTTETWYIRFSNTSGAPDVVPFKFGAPGWIPLAGDWTGTGRSGIGVYDPSTGTFYLRSQASSGAADVGVFKFGAPGWKPLAGNWSGGSRYGIGVVDPTTNTFYLRNTPSAGGVDFAPFQFGAPGWKPVAADWAGSGMATVAVVDPSGNWYIRFSNSSGAPSIAPFNFGVGTWTPLGGNWQPPAPAMQYASSAGVGASSLDAGTLEGVVQAALARLTAAGIDSDVVRQLASAHFFVANSLLPGALGETFTATNTVLISADAAGNGWFVDPTPLEDAEFAADGTALPGSAAAGHADLLTTVLHEMGHLVGRPDVSGVQQPSDLMADTLPLGVRHTNALDEVFSIGL